MMKTRDIALAGALAWGVAQAQDTVDCKANAYVIDRNPQGLSVRADPAGTGKALARLREGALVHVTGGHGSWIRIDRAETESASGEFQAVFSGEGWIQGASLGVGPAWNLDGNTALREQPATRAKLLTQLAFDNNPGAVLQGCSGGWLDLQYNTRPTPLRGWVEAIRVCTSPRTTCG